jgi:histidinol phosphatase-like enzyme
MANKKTDQEKLKELKQKMSNLRATNKDLLARHAEDQAKIKKYEEMIANDLKDIQEAMNEVYLKSMCEEYGEPVLDEETNELLGKRLEFRALRKNNYKLNLAEKLFYPEDDRFISTITVGITYPAEEEEENNGKD